MIYGNSGDPVFIKKISLKVWTLRDELESVIRQRVANGEKVPNLKDLLLEYKSNGIPDLPQAPSEEVKDAADLDDFGEDEMAAAIAEAAGGVKDASELDDFGEDEMAAAIAAAAAGEDPDAELAEEEDATDEAQGQDAIDALMEGGGEAQDQDAIDALMEGGGEAQDQDAIDALMEGGGEAQSQDDIDSLFGGGEDVKVEEEERPMLTEPEEIDGRTILKQRLPKIPDDKIHIGRAILSEIYMDHMYFFCSENFLEGQSIVLEFLVPRKFIMNAQVVFCRKYNLKSRVISKNRLPYRVGIKFTYLKDGERTILRNFVQSIEPDVEVVQAPAKSGGDGGGGDDFDIFDELE